MKMYMIKRIRLHKEFDIILALSNKNDLCKVKEELSETYKTGYYNINYD
jgi:hypothetical protein